MTSGPNKIEVISNANIQRSKYIILLLTTISFVLWCISLIQAKNIEIGDYGLFSVLPWTFYAGFYLLLTSIYYTIFIKKNWDPRFYRWSLLIQLFLVMIFIFFTPALIEGTARVPHSWLKYGYTDYIVRNGFISQTIWYHNWPAPFIYSAQFVQITSMSPTTFPLVFPLILDLIIFFIILLLFFKFFSDSKKRFVGVLIFYLIAWENQFHYAPQILAFVLFLLLVYLIHFKLNTFDLRYLIIISVLFVILILTHLLTAIVISLYLGFFILYNLVLSKTIRTFRVSKKNIMILLACIIAAISLWVLFASSWLTSADWHFNPGTILSLASAYLSKLGEGSDAHTQLVLIRMIFSVAIALLAIIGSRIVVERYQRRSMYLLILAGIIPIFLFFYGVEIVQRAFLFCSLPLAVLICFGLGRKKIFTVILIFSIVAVPFHILAMYGNEKIDYTPPSQISGAEFIFDNISEGYIIGGNSVEWSQYLERYGRGSLNDILTTSEFDEGTYLVYTSSAENFAVWYHGNNNNIESIKQKTQTSEYNKIFSSPDCTIYKIS